MSTIYNIKLNVVSDWSKWSEEEIEKIIKGLFKDNQNDISIRLTGDIKVKEDKYGGIKNINHHRV